ILLLLDEIDLYLHPEWQRTILSTLLNLIKSINNNVKVQIIMSSHSPIIASDFLSVDIVTLLRSTKKKINTGTLEEVGYGESIDKMMSQGFFLKSTVGDRVLTTIDFLI
ncbi:AAA family ATPase, partial [Klebsiella pneumoniae]